MSAVIVKGLIISIAVAAALALQTPEVTVWIDEQRRKLADILRSMSEGLDPQTRREAEAFAFDGLTATASEAVDSSHALAVATGSDSPRDIVSRRLNRQHSASAEEAAERRRLGREYLARRNQEMMDRHRGAPVSQDRNGDGLATDLNAKLALDGPQQRRQSSNFDDMINQDGTLRPDEKQAQLASDSAPDPPIFAISETPLAAPVAVKAFHGGSAFGNPFGDEFAMSDDRSETPRPSLPPKIALEDSSEAHIGNRDASDTPPESLVIRSPRPESAEIDTSDDTEGVSDELSFDEQLARALSLSMAEQERTSLRRMSPTHEDDDELAQAIRASLQEVNGNGTVRDGAQQRGPLVDLSGEDMSTSQLPRLHQTNPWTQASDDDLYFLTPHSTGAQKPQTSVDAVMASSFLSDTSSSMFESLPSVPTHDPQMSQRASLRIGDQELPSSLRVVVPTPSASLAATMLSPAPRSDVGSSAGFRTDSEADEFTSVAGSVGQSEGSVVEVEDVDVDSMSDSDDDGVRTPQSWSEVGSDVGDASERSDSETEGMVRL